MTTETPNLTDRSALALHRARADRAPALFLHEDAAGEIKERLSEIKKSFTRPAIVGGMTAPYQSDLPDAVVVRDRSHLALRAGSHDLIVHGLALHWADDPVGQLVQSRLALCPDGLFLGVMFGGQTLSELRSALAEAETHLTGGLSPRVAPMIDIRDAGALLQRAGFALPVADTHKVIVRYRTLTAFLHDLRAMGETNALASRHRRFAPRDLFALTETIYRDNFADEDGMLLATFEVVYLTGWAPDASQQQPLRPGSATARLSDALGVDERANGDNARPKPR